MRTGSAAYVAAIGTPDQIIVTQVTVFWGPTVPGGVPTDLSAAFETITPSADLTTDMPAGTKDITGYPARTCQMTLGGSVDGNPDHSAAWLFDPYSPTSPLYGIDWTGTQGGTAFQVSQGLALPGVAPEVFPIFSGFVDDMVVNRSTGEVQFTLEDTRSQLRTVPQIPPAVTYINSGSVNNDIICAPGLTSIWPLDYLLRTNGLYSGPPPRPGCAFYMSGHGSMWPEMSTGTFQPLSRPMVAVGTEPQNSIGGIFPTVPAAAPPLVPGAYGCASVIANGSFTDAMAVPINAETGQGYYVEFSIESQAILKSLPVLEFTLGNTRVPVSSPNDFQILLQQSATGDLTLRSGGVSVRLSFVAIAGYTTTTGAGWHRLGFQVTFTTATACTVDAWVDGVHVNSGSVTVPASPGGALAYVDILSGNPFESVQVSQELGATGPAPFTIGAVLDPSLNSLVGIPAYTNTDAWTLTQDIVEAEFGYGGFDEAWPPTFFFKNRLDTPAAAQATVTSKINLKDLQFEINEANRALAIYAQVHPLALAGPEIVYSQSGLITIPASGRITVTVTTTTAVVGINSSFIPIPIGGLPDASHSGYMANTLPDGSGTAVTLAGVAAIQVSPTSVQIILVNSMSVPVYLAPTTGYDSINGVLALAGFALADQNDGQGVQVSASYLGATVPSLTLTDNLWRQDIAIAQQLVLAQLGDLVRPRPMITQLTIVGDARLQLGDRVQLQDEGNLASLTAPAKMADDFILLNIHPSIDASSGFTQQITARAVGLPRQWILGQVGKSELGVTTYI